MINRHATVIMVIILVTITGCTSIYREAGSYKVIVAGDNFFGLFCQPRQEYYFVEKSLSNSKPLYLGTCGTPRFITKHFHMPNDPSCFAISKDGASIVYLHRPELCGAGNKASQKPGGVYIHSREGDRLLYPESQILQVWGGSDVGENAIRVDYIGNTPSKSGATCSQGLVIDANGNEAPEGSADAKSYYCTRH